MDEFFEDAEGRGRTEFAQNRFLLVILVGDRSKAYNISLDIHIRTTSVEPTVNGFWVPFL